MTTVTKNTMKTIITTIITALLIILSFTGCSKDKFSSECVNSNDPACYTQQEIAVTPPRSLNSILSSLDKTISINKMTVIDGSNRELVFKLVPSSNEPNEILAQYEIAYTNNYELLKKLLPTKAEQELEELKTLYETPRTVDSIMISSINVSGPLEMISKFKARMEE